jgi:16S rRNA (cytosine1402-N4)-methyltransferase
MGYHHITAMRKETVDLLQLTPGMKVADCTLGSCGHALDICTKIIPPGRFIGIDQDPDAIENAHVLLKPFGESVHIFYGNFIQLPDFISQLGLMGVDAILADLGLSLNQIENSGRGFSFKRDEPLDMRMDTRANLTAATIVNHWSDKELADIFRKFGEERWARLIARKLVMARKQNPFTTSRQLAQFVVDTIPKNAARNQKIHPATRVFMALRIAVNHELERLETFLESAIGLLNKKGRLCILSFHSLEDRIVKHKFKKLAVGCTCPPRLPQCACGKRPQVKLLTPKVKRPGKKEIEANPMARSTRLRAIEKC